MSVEKPKPSEQERKIAVGGIQYGGLSEGLFKLMEKRETDKLTDTQVVIGFYKIMSKVGKEVMARYQSDNEDGLFDNEVTLYKPYYDLVDNLVEQYDESGSITQQMFDLIKDDMTNDLNFRATSSSTRFVEYNQQYHAQHNLTELVNAFTKSENEIKNLVKNPS